MEYKLTQYSHGAGCGCKIAPAVLDQMLHSTLPQPTHDNLLVGNGTRDDNHPSETAMDDYPHFAAVLHNTGSRDDLTRQVRALLRRL